MRCDDKSAIIKCLDGSLEAAQGLGEAHVHFEVEVHLLAAKGGVFALFENDYDVARLETRRLVALAVERNLLTIFHTLTTEKKRKQTNTIKKIEFIGTINTNKKNLRF